MTEIEKPARYRCNHDDCLYEAADIKDMLEHERKYPLHLWGKIEKEEGAV